MPKAKSLKQARFFGLIASGKRPRKKTSLTSRKAKEMLRGLRLKRLPKIIKRKK